MRLVYSKWFYYGLVAIALFVIICFLLYEMSVGNDMATRFLPTFVGLMFTLVIFMTFFDIRENLEWKEVEDRVKKRIGKEIHSIFVELSNLCEVDRESVGDVHNCEAWNEQRRKQLKQMTEKVELNDWAKEMLEKNGLALHLASFFDSRRTLLSEIEGKYFRFLNPKLRASLIDIQDCLEDLRFELKGRGADISTVIKKITKEIASIRESGIDIGF